jgi:hypothetical protein
MGDNQQDVAIHGWVFLQDFSALKEGRLPLSWEKNGSLL